MNKSHFSHVVRVILTLTPAIAAIIAVVASCGGRVSSESFTQPELIFSERSTFKIVQFTDLHIEPGGVKTDTTEATIRAVVEKEHPDLVVLTGDVICYDPATKGWEDICSLFEELKLPFTVTLGNHDAEYLSRDSIFTLVMKSPMYVGDKGPENLRGCGNTAIPILGKNGKPAAVVYCLDSNDYNEDRNLGSYDWIHSNQVAWYNVTSAKFAEENDGKPLPSVMFFHIPLPEYALVVDDEKTYGNRHEGAGAGSEINSGLFAALVENRDVMGVFTGHDHNNDYVGLKFDVALGFGRCTGAQAYGNLERGGRIIELREGENSFSTYVSMPTMTDATWYYPSGISSKEVEEMTYLPASDVSVAGNGVKYNYYEGLIKHTSHIKPEMKAGDGTMKNFDITKAPAEDHFAYVFDAVIDVPEKDVYRFYTLSDDGSVLYIDGQLVVDNDGGHSARRREGKVALEKGKHLLHLDYYENYMGQQLEVGWCNRSIRETIVPDSVLYLPN